MTEVNWLVEDGPFEEDLDPIIAEIEKQGHPLKIIKYEPFESGSYRHLYPEDACVVFYGSINLARQLQRETPWIPGPILTQKNYLFSAQIAHFGEYMLNGYCQFMPFGKFKRQVETKHWISLDKLINPYTGTIFVRPDSGLKTFTGQSLVWDNCKSDMIYLDSRCDPETMIAVSYGKPLDFEYRLIVVGDKIVSGSQYKDNNKHKLETSYDSNVPEIVIRTAEKYLSKIAWRPDTVFAMDMHMYKEDMGSDEDNVRIIEFNSFSSSGLYACDPEPIIREVSRVALEEWTDIHEIL